MPSNCRRVRAGDTVKFRIRVTNLGTETGRNVVVCDLLPRGMTLIKAPRSSRSIGTAARACRLPRMRGQVEGFITVRVTRTASGTP